MLQKVLTVGTSAAVVISKQSLKTLGVKPGDMVIVEEDASVPVVLIRPPHPVKVSQRHKKIASLTLDFIERHRHDLQALATK